MDIIITTVMVNMVKRNPQMSDNVNEVKEQKPKKKFKIDVKNNLILLADFIAIILAYHVSLATIFSYDRLYLAYDSDSYMVIVAPFYALFMNVLFFIFRLYKNNGEFDRMKETTYLLIANFIAIVIYVVTMWMLGAEYSYAFYLMGGLLQYFFTSGIRYVYRFFFLKRNKKLTER